MRLPVTIGRSKQRTIEVVRYAFPGDGEAGPSRWIAELGADGTNFRHHRLKISVGTFRSRRPSADSELDTQAVSKPTTGSDAVVLVPRYVSRRTRSRGWERLQVSSESRLLAGDGRQVEAWLIVPIDGPYKILIFPGSHRESFMADLPDQMPWQDLALVGTHDSSAFHGYPFAQCQQPSTSITQQLHDGARFLDFRMRVVDGELIMYHGIQNQRALFTSILSEIHTFLSQHPSESLLVSLKEEVPPIHPDFAELVWDALAPHVDQYWFLETRLPTLGEIRGRGMIMPRFLIPDPQPGLWDKGVGLKLESWPDNNPDGFELGCGGDSIRVQDWYGVSSILRIPDKLKVVTDHLQPTITKSFPRSGCAFEETRPLTISYLSAAAIPLAPPQLLAKGLGWPSIGLGIEGLNSRLTRWLLELMYEGKRIRGIVPIDFYRQEGDLGALLVAMNYTP